MTISIKRTAILAATAFGVSMAAAAPASAQELRRDENGGWSVHYPGPCWVTYTANGVRTANDRQCSRAQIYESDDIVRNRRFQDPRFNQQRGWRYGYQGRQPRVRVYRNGSGYVDFRDGCMIRYNRSGNRISSPRRCDRGQRRYADVVFRQEAYGGSRRGSRYGYNYAQPYADSYGGLIRVRLSNLDCTYMYTRQGNHVQTIGRDCNSQVRQIANDEARRYQRARGW